VVVHDNAAFILIYLNTQIYIYKKNGTELFDILMNIKRPELCDSVILKTDSDNIMIGYIR
jgi:hypothetical protein